MTRQKKSRKIGQIGVRKQESRPTEPSNPRRRKTPKGQKSGSRNSLIDEQLAKGQASPGPSKKDPKVGSKKKIDLSPASTPALKVEKEVKHSKAQPQVQLEKVVAETVSPQQELAALENDERLIDLAQRVENGELLTGKDAKFFNRKMDRHAELLDILGLNDEDDEEEDPLTRLEADQWDDLLDEKG